MFDHCQKPTGRDCTMPVALLVAAFIGIAAILILSRAVGYGSVSLAPACSAAGLGIAWLHWKRRSQLTIPSIAARRTRSK